MSRFSNLLHIPVKHIVAGLAIRELLAPWTGHPYDFEIWTRLGFYMQTLGSPYHKLAYLPGLSFSPFPTTGSLGYPPLSAFIFALTFRVYVLLGEPSRFVYYFLLKQPMILADVGAALVLGKIVLLSGSSESARTSSLIWLYFPFGIIISSMWGQLDPIAMFLSLIAAYYFIVSKWAFSAISLGLAAYLKILPIVFLPIFLIQPGLALSRKVTYSLISLGIPIAGTLFPAEFFNWNLQGVYNYLQFQVAIPGTGGMSLLGVFYVIPFLSNAAQYFTPFLWIPVLAVSYVYVWKRDLGLLQGLVVTVLAFIVSRPFFSEQYMVYPLAFLLMRVSRKNILHFFSLATASTIFLVANNTLLVIFFTPILPGVYEGNFLTTGQPLYASIRATAMLASIAACYFESLSLLLGRESIISRTMTTAKLLSRIYKLKLSPFEARNP